MFPCRYLLLSVALLLGHGAGAEEIADPLTQLTTRAQAHRVMLVGELHGTWEIPGIFAGLASNLALDERPLIVGLEIWRSEQPALDRYLASAGTEADRAELLSHPFWAVRDGRSSEAMVKLLERLRVLMLKSEVRVVAFDAPHDDKLTGAQRDRAMGELLLAELAAAPDARLLVLAGNFHTRVQGSAPWDPEHRFMGHYLAEHQPYAVELMGVRGSAWMCPQPDDCRAWQLPEAPRPPGLQLGEDLNDRRHHGVWWLQETSASPPAQGADAALLEPQPLSRS